MHPGRRSQICHWGGTVTNCSPWMIVSRIALHLLDFLWPQQLCDGDCVPVLQRRLPRGALTLSKGCDFSPVMSVPRSCVRLPRRG